MYILYTLVFPRKQRNLRNVNVYKKPEKNLSKREKPIVSKIIEFSEEKMDIFLIYCLLNSFSFPN